eukprot:gnl/Spiro4/396_TR215_c0_g1_i1.p1 gnl/Spiro4/396_TR215_c0_g1~~gnl/Spiro4/396_TR215_c0_g1_i1.p1  ORF type:complete len:584 (+),score=118.27 gnl/Spiro4/396_TR215_c0_g1_i1:142-1893(+)
MACYYIAGRADCTKFAKAEYVGSAIKLNCKEIKVEIITKHPAEWSTFVQTELFQKNGFTSLTPSTSPVIWSSNGRLIGSLFQWEQYVATRFGIHEEISDEVLNASARETLNEAEVAYFLRKRDQALGVARGRLKQLDADRLVQARQEEILKETMVYLRAMALIAERQEQLKLSTGFGDQFLLANVSIPSANLRSTSQLTEADILDTSPPPEVATINFAAGVSVTLSKDAEDHLASKGPPVSDNDPTDGGSPASRHIRFAPDVVGGEDETTEGSRKDDGESGDEGDLGEDSPEKQVARRSQSETEARASEAATKLVQARERHAQFKKKFAELFQSVLPLKSTLTIQPPPPPTSAPGSTTTTSTVISTAAATSSSSSSSSSSAASTTTPTVTTTTTTTTTTMASGQPQVTGSGALTSASAATTTTAATTVTPTEQPFTVTVEWGVDGRHYDDERNTLSALIVNVAAPWPLLPICQSFERLCGHTHALRQRFNRQLASNRSLSNQTRDEISNLLNFILPGETTSPEIIAAARKACDLEATKLKFTLSFADNCVVGAHTPVPDEEGADELMSARLDSNNVMGHHPAT